MKSSAIHPSHKKLPRNTIAEVVLDVFEAEFFAVAAMPLSHRRQHMLDLVKKAAKWDSDLHPRGKNGRFISKDKLNAAKSDPRLADELRSQVRPEDADKLESVLSGKVDPGQTKQGQKKQAAREKKEKKEASRTRAAELAAKATRGEATREELAELADHLPALNVKQLRQVRAALYAKLGGVTRRDEILAKITAHAKGMAEGDTQHARKQDEAAADRKAARAERAAKRDRVRAKVKEYGFLRPDDSEFQAHFGSLGAAVKEWGLSVGLFRRDGNGFDEVAERMAKDGHFTVRDDQKATDALWEALTQDAVSMVADRKDEFADAEAAYYKELAAVAADQGVQYEYGADLTAEDLFGDDEQAAAAYRRADELAGQAVAADPYGAGGGGADTSFDFGFNAPVGERLTGGLADGKADAEFPPEQLREGAKVEGEHTADPAAAKEIAKDHLAEDPQAYTPAADETKGDAEPVSQKPLISDAGKSPDSGKQEDRSPATSRPSTPPVVPDKPAGGADKPNSGSKPVVATRPLEPRKPAPAPPREKTEAELEREQRAAIDARVAADKLAKKQEAVDEWEAGPDAPPSRGATFVPPDEGDTFHAAVYQHFPGDTPAERFAAARAARDGKRRAAASDLGMTLEQFDAELAQRGSDKQPANQDTPPDAPAADRPFEQWSTAELLAAQDEVEARGRAGMNLDPTPDHKAKVQGVLDRLQAGATGRGTDGWVPIWKLRREVAKAHPDMTPEQFDAVLLDMRRPKSGGSHRLVSIDDRSRYAPGQIFDGVHAVGQQFFYLEPSGRVPDKQSTNQDTPPDAPPPAPTREEQLAALLAEQAADAGAGGRRRKKRRVDG